MRQILFITLLILLYSCKKENEAEVIIPKPYPDCFENMTRTHYSVGCGRSAVQLDTDRRVSISFDEEALSINPECKTFSIADFQNEIRVSYMTYINHPDSIYFDDSCSDVGPFESRPYGTRITTWKAISGTVILSVSKEKHLRVKCEDYRTSIALRDIKFIKENSTQDTIINEIIFSTFFDACIP